MSKFLPYTFLMLAISFCLELNAQAPANDNCADAIAIGSGDYSFTTIDATTDGPYHPGACTGGTADSLYNDVWYVFTADFTGTALFSTCGTADFDSNIAVYAPGSSCPPSENDVITCNEDGSGCAGYTSKLFFDVTSGESYLLRIGGWGNSSPGEEGSGTFSVSQYIAPSGPPNDNCADAIAIGPGDFSFTTLGANTDGPSHANDCPSSGATPDSTYNDVWYLFTPDFTGFAEFSTCSTADFDTKIIVYAPGTACPPTDDDVLACNEDGAGCTNSTSKTIFEVTSGSTYLLRLGGWGDGSPGEEGSGTFSVQQYFPSGPANAFCASAIDLDLGAEDSIVVAYSTVDALSDGPTHILQSCFDPGETEVYNNVWYTFTPDFDGWMEWSNCGTANYDSRVAIYASTACPPDPQTLVGCGDDGIDDDGLNCPDYTSRAYFPVENGVSYSISVGGWSSSDQGDGTFVLKRIDMPDFPSNDNCATPDTAYVITTLQADEFEVVFEGNTLHATWDDTQTRPSCRAIGEHWDVWYRFNSGENTDLELRFNKVNTEAEFVIDLFTACGEPDISASAYCLRTDSQVTDFIKDTLSGFPGVPTEYLLRVTTRVTGDRPGDFWFQLVGEPYTSVKDMEASLNNFRFAPNPAKDRATVQFDLNESAASANWSIVNLLGQVVSYRELGLLSAGPHQVKLSLENLNKGIYFFRLMTDKGQKTVRFVCE